MKWTLALGALALLAAAVAWLWVAVRKFAARKQAEAAREAAFLAELARAPPPSLPPASPAAADRPGDTSARIREALQRGRGAEAAALFTSRIENRAGLKLAPMEWDALGRVLLAQGAFLEAGWTLHAGALLAGDAVAAQKRLVEAAARASAAGQPRAALRLYATLLEKYPASEFAPFVRSSMKGEERKLKGQSSA
jgi:hypothetical protein